MSIVLQIMGVICWNVTSIQLDYIIDVPSCRKRKTMKKDVEFISKMKEKNEGETK